MPIYEYRCKKCQSAFEYLVRAEDLPTCPQCGASGEDLEKLISAPVAHSGGSNPQPSGGCSPGSSPSCACCPWASRQ